MPELKALAIKEQKTFIIEMPVLQKVEAEAFLDFEGIPDRGSNYLIGIILKTNDSVTEYSFWADDSEDEGGIFVELIELLKPFKNLLVYHYGSYEIQALQSIAKKMPQEYKEALSMIVENSFNLPSIFTNNVYPPTYSNSLKEIARFLKFEWTEKDATGLQSTVWRYKWELSRNEDLKNKLLQYNIDDCKALKLVKDWLVEIPKNESENYIKAENVKRNSIFKWQRNNFLIKEFDQINHFAYFNYQREKVLIKTYPEIAARQKILNSQKQKAKKEFKPNIVVLLSRPTICDKCRNDIFYIHDKVKRIIIDLKITSTSIKRCISSYQLVRYECKKCGYVFTPKNTFFHIQNMVEPYYAGL